MPNDLVAIANYPNNVDAQVSKSILEGAGIKCWVFDDSVSTMLPLLAGMISARLMVKREDTRQALEVLGWNEMLDKIAMCPSCESAEVSEQNHSFSEVISSIFSSKTPFLLFKKKYICENCGNAWGQK